MSFFMVSYTIHHLVDFNWYANDEQHNTLQYFLEEAFRISTNYYIPHKRLIPLWIRLLGLFLKMWRLKSPVCFVYCLLGAMSVNGIWNIYKRRMGYG